MLFNSFPFTFLFLPACLILFYGLGRLERRAAAAFLALASLFFYGWWNSRYVLLLVASICGNFLLSEAIVRNKQRPAAARLLLVIAVAADLALLGYYKYVDFFVANLGILTGANLELLNIALPLGISFFTFTQIAFLVDSYRNVARERDFVHYLLFITYFPHLIAGPILHHAEMMPQFGKSTTYRFHPERLAAGTTLFILGLAKKVICADGISPVARTVFGAAAAGDQIDLLHAWSGALAYTMQIYFDFSAYCDMALGISIMFGIRLPLNFDSPYKAASIIDFWRRWHMTLSRFLRDYLYIPLGGSRCTPPRRYLNLMVTMLLGGLWHGAAWTYVAWGGLHGFYLVMNHGWRYVKPQGGGNLMTHAGSVLLTFLCVVVAWVFFRAQSIQDAFGLLRGMAGLHGLNNPSAPYISNQQMLCLPLLAGVCWLLPNSYQILGSHSPALQTVPPTTGMLTWKPSPAWAACLGMLAALCVAEMLSGAPSEFIYFQF
jgi:D-alanyl-lipoteichoic acid acyltransferase DltB (MBOAT superfamily)